MISVIIPSYNEASQIAATIVAVQEAGAGNVLEIIVSDGGSTDDTLGIAGSCGAVTLPAAKGRSIQMNRGASAARAPVLYFLHADSIPPKNFDIEIQGALDAGAVAGCFKLAFDKKHWFLKANCWFTRFDVNAVRFGDQSLFITKNAFIQSGGFREDLLMMEDQEIIHRIKEQGRFVILGQEVITSARKYIDNGIFRMQGIFFLIWSLYYLGFSQKTLLRLHRRLIRKAKI